MKTYETEYKYDGYDEFEVVKPAPEYRLKQSQNKAWQAVQQYHGLTTVIRLECGALHAVKGRAEIIGVYDPSISAQQFWKDIA